MESQKKLQKQPDLHDKQKSNGNEENLECGTKEMIEIYPVEKTPFTIIKNGEKYSITIGLNIVRDNLKSKEEAEELIEKKEWRLILTSAAVYVDCVNEQKKY